MKSYELPAPPRPRVHAVDAAEIYGRWKWETGLMALPGPLGTTDGVTNPIFMVFRNSGQSGRGPAEAVHNDAKAACESLRKLCSIDFSGLLPSAEKLRQMFRAAKVRRSVQRDGTKFTHRVIELDFRREHGVYMVFILGSGRKVDDHLRQPAVELLTEIVRRIQPSILFASHVSRVVRVAWAFGPLVSELTYIGAYLGDGLRGVQDVSDRNAVDLFVQALQGEAEAKTFYMRSRDGTRQHVSSEMEAGVALAGCVSPHPPGLARVRLKDGLGTGESVLVFDNAGGLPAEEAVAYGYPRVFDEHGVHVDQVALVRKALSQIGKVSLGAVGAELVANGFSTHGIRVQTGRDDARYIGHRPRDAAHRILHHLEFYRSGKLHVSIGIEAERWTISGIIPPDGPWATPEDFERIDEWMAAESAIKRRARRTTFGSLKLKVNGIAAMLIPYKGGEKYHGGLVFRPTRLDSPNSADSVHRGLAIRHVDIARAVVDSLKAAGDQAFGLLTIPKSHPVELDYALHRLVVERDGHEAQRAGLREQLSERDGAGNRLITGDLLNDLNADYGKVKADLAATEDKMSVVQEQIAAADAASLRASRSIATDELLRLIATLSDPLCTEYQAMWRNSLVDVEITASDVRIGEVRGIEWELTGMLRIGSGDRQIHIPVHARRNTAREKAGVKVAAIIAEMRDGTPLECVTIGGVEALQGEVADVLGLKVQNRILLACRDPRIFSIAMRLGSAGEAPAAIAADTGEPIELVERIHDLYWLSPGSRWRRRSVPNYFVCSSAAIRHNGIVPMRELTEALSIDTSSLNTWLRNHRWSEHWTYIRSNKTFRVSGCRHCGSHALAYLRLYEADSWLCLSCERDRAGVSWPLSTYAFYVDSAAEWRAIGIDVPDMADPHPPRLVFRHRRAPRAKTTRRLREPVAAGR